MDTLLRFPVSVIVERRPAKNPWADQVLVPVAVAEGGPDIAPWTLLVREGQVASYHAGKAEIELHRKETEAYGENFLGDNPKLYVILREDSGAEAPFGYRLFGVTASPFNAQKILDAGEDIVEPVPMPVDLARRIRAFIDFHHVEEPFRKRRRGKANDPDEAFTRPPDWSPAGGEPWEN